jgi:hypothetical protein
MTDLPSIEAPLILTLRRLDRQSAPNFGRGDEVELLAGGSVLPKFFLGRGGHSEKARAPLPLKPTSLATMIGRAYLKTMVPTLAELQRDSTWLWVCCEAQGCGHMAPMAIAPLLIRWGIDASSDGLRASACCSRCGRIPSLTSRLTSVGMRSCERRNGTV